MTDVQLDLELDKSKGPSLDSLKGLSSVPRSGSTWGKWSEALDSKLLSVR